MLIETVTPMRVQAPEERHDTPFKPRATAGTSKVENRQPSPRQPRGLHVARRPRPPPPLRSCKVAARNSKKG